MKKYQKDKKIKGFPWCWISKNGNEYCDSCKLQIKLKLKNDRIK